MITSHPQVVRLVLSADACSIGPGESVSLNVKGFDARGGEIVLTDLRWALADPAKGTLIANGAQAVFTAAPRGRRHRHDLGTLCRSDGKLVGEDIKFE